MCLFVCVHAQPKQKSIFVTSAAQGEVARREEMTHRHPDCLCLRGEQPPTEASSALRRDD